MMKKFGGFNALCIHFGCQSIPYKLFFTVFEENIYIRCSLLSTTRVKSIDLKKLIINHTEIHAFGHGSMPILGAYALRLSAYALRHGAYINALRLGA